MYKNHITTQVAPAELDAVLTEHPDIVEAAVVGIPDTVAGELPFACIVKKPGSPLTEKDVYDFVAGRCERNVIYFCQIQVILGICISSNILIYT